MGKTPEYTKKAINNYRDKFDFIQIRFPKGTRQRLEAAEIGNINDYVVDWETFPQKPKKCKIQHQIQKRRRLPL